jgi:uncharacterized protein YjbI with pentapeptide repeats
MTGVTLTNSFLSNVRLDDANLYHARCMGSVFHSVSFDNARLKLVNFTEARLRDCSLAGATMSNTTFTGAIIRDTEDRSSVRFVNFNKKGNVL